MVFLKTCTRVLNYLASPGPARPGPFSFRPSNLNFRPIDFSTRRTRFADYANWISDIIFKTISSDLTVSLGNDTIVV